MSDWRDALQKQDGCGLFMIAVGIIFFGGLIYMFVGGGNPANKKSFDDCYRQELGRYGSDGAIADCVSKRRSRIQGQ